MKIYTEINYKWLDGQLVETDSKSFEYDGEVTLCGFGGGGGGGGGGTLGDITSGTGSVMQELSSVTADPVGDVLGAGADVVTESADILTAGTEEVMEAATDPLDMAGNVVSDVVDATATTVVDPIIHATDQATGILTEGLSTGMDAIGAEASNIGEAATTNASNLAIGGTTKDLLDKTQSTLDGALSGIATSINDGLGYLTPSGGGGPKVELEKMKSRKGKLKNKNVANLKVNKSKGRARKSLRIG